MRKTKFPRSLRKRIRTEKAKTKKESLTFKEAEDKIEEMYRKIIGKKR